MPIVIGAAGFEGPAEGGLFLLVGREFLADPLGLGRIGPFVGGYKPTAALFGLEDGTLGFFWPAAAQLSKKRGASNGEEKGLDHRSNYSVIDSAARARELPATWRHPPPEALAQVRPGCYIRIGVEPIDGGSSTGERFWCLVTAIAGDHIHCGVRSRPSRQFPVRRV